MSIADAFNSVAQACRRCTTLSMDEGIALNASLSVIKQVVEQRIVAANAATAAAANAAKKGPTKRGPSKKATAGKKRNKKG